jgi:hypothetical protein
MLEPSRRPTTGIPAGHHGSATAPASTKKSPPPNCLTPAINSPTPLLVAPRTATDTSLSPPSPPAPPPLSTAAEAHRPPPPHAEPPPPTTSAQGEDGERTPSSPSVFSPSRHPRPCLEGRQSATARGPPIPSLSWSRREEERGMTPFAQGPLPLFLFPPKSPLLYFSLSLFQINPTPLNYTTKQPLLIYKQALRPF